MRLNEQGISLHDVDFRLEQCGADPQQRLRTVGELNADQIAFDQGQPSALQDLASLFRMAEEKSHEGAFGRIVDGQGDDANFASLESPHDLEQLADTVLQKDGEL